MHYLFEIVFCADSDPVCNMMPNTTELMYNQIVQMSCRITFTANAYVAVDMIWSNDSSATVVSSSTQNSTSANLTTVVSTVTQTTGYSTPFPIYKCNTTFKVTGIPSGSATNAPGYSNLKQLFNSPIDVICK